MTNTNFNLQPNVNNSSVVLAAQPSEMGTKQTMSSLEMAELAGRNHKDLLRSIRSMESAWIKVTGRKFSLSEYEDSTGRLLPCYNFNYEESMYIASKFDDETRAKLTIRWAKLETGQAVPMYQVSTTQHPKPLSLKDQLTWVKEVSKIMKLNDASTLGMLQQIAQPLNLPVPNYTPSKGFLASATELIERNGLKGKITAEKLNNMLRDKGYVEKRTRPSKKGAKNFHALTEKGLKWGENQVSPHNQKETQIQYYEDKFPQLLQELGLLQKGE